MTFFLIFLFLFSLQTLDDNDNFYVIFESGNENVTFSSYRLNNPERIVFEADGTFNDAEFHALPKMIKSVEKSESNGTTRFIFFVEAGSQYTFFNRKGTVIIAFSSSIFLDDENFDTVIAKFQAKREAKLLAKAEKKRKIKEKRIAEEKRRFEEEKRLAELKKAEEEKRLAEEEKRIAELRKAEEKRLAELKKAEEKKRLAEEKRIAKIKKAEEKKRLAEEKKRIAELKKAEEKKRLAEEKRIAELKKAEEKKRLAEEKRIAELKKAEEKKRLAEEKRIAELKKAEEKKRLAEEKRIAELKKAEEKKRLAEEKRIAELRKAEEKKRLAEEKRIAELRKAEEKKRIAEEEKRIAELRKAEEKKRLAEEKRLAELKKAETEKEKQVAAPQLKTVKSKDGEIRQLKVTKVEKEPTLAEKLPDLPVVKLTKKGKLKNLFFRKFPEFSRVTMELDGEVDYQFREIVGGFVIDVHNFAKIPQYLLNIIDTRAFKAEVTYILPKKVDDVLKIYIKTKEGMAVRKSMDKKYIHFDFYKPTIE